MNTKRNNWERVAVEYKITSLDFPCDFCESNSYRNYHIHIGEKALNICSECLESERALVEEQLASKTQETNK